MALINKIDGMEPLSTRQIAGQIIEGEISARGWKFKDAPVHMAMSRITLHRMKSGEVVQRAQYRKAEHALDLPFLLFDHIVNGDVAAIRAIDMDPTLKGHILTALQATKGPAQQRRRQSDR
jgi:hypothetical protein